MKRQGAGILFEREDGRILLLLRSMEVMDPGVWAIPGGQVEPGETVKKAAILETEEEMGPVPPFRVVSKDVYKSGDFEYTTLRAKMKEKDAKNWQPILNWENDEWGWFEKDALPEPIHPNVAEAIYKFSI